jgi:hypothetical protein
LAAGLVSITITIEAKGRQPHGDQTVAQRK